jgi:hypothetical protein
MRRFVWLAIATSIGCSSSSSNDSTSPPTDAGANTDAASAADAKSAADGAKPQDSGGGGDSAVVGSKWPSTNATIAVLADQLPNGMSTEQQSFAASHFVGSQKLTLSISGPLRAVNPNFIVLHYHLSIWQSAPATTFIIDGVNWGNDYPMVTMNEGWFWHNTQNQRVASVNDGKLLMNLLDPGFAAYWESSLEQQVAAGQYDGIFFDSASPALLQAEAQNPPEPRLQGTGARDTAIAEWGGKTYIQGWESWMSALNDALAAKGIPLIPNTSAFITGWDNTDYSLTAGIFSEGYADTSFAESDWKASTNMLLSLAAKGKIMILQNYLGTPTDLAKRMYYLGNYLLVKGDRTYLDYFAAGPLEWYPEWGVDLGAPTNTAMIVDDLAKNGVYERDFAKGIVLVNPSASPVTVTLPATMQHVVPQGGGAVDVSGATPGSITTTPIGSISVAATGAEILLF